MKHSTIGKILQEMGILGSAQLEAALHVQKANQLKLGEILIKLNFVSEKELAMAIAKQHNLEYIELENYVPKIEALSLIDDQFVKLNTLLPISVDNDILYIATPNPDKDMKDYLEGITDRKIVFKVSTYTSTIKSIHIYYEQSQKSIETRIDNIILKAADENEVDIIGLSDLLIDHAIKEKATDIHIVPEVVSTHIFYRVDGILHHYHSLPFHFHKMLSTHLKVLAKLDIANNIIAQTGEFEHKDITTSYNIRISIIPTIKGEKLALRLHPKNFKLCSLKCLGFESDLIQKLEEHLNKNTGMLLIIGPSGSGKSTTLYSLLRKINILERNVMSIEEPVELQLPFINQIQINTKVGLSYAESIRHIARQDPDVIVVGEILDEETARLALQASLGGHLVLSTIFGKNPSSMIARLVDFHIDRYSLSDGLTGILSQRLVRRLCSYCKESVNISKGEILREFNTNTLKNMNESSFTIYQPKGCVHCKQTGYIGRIAITEFFEITSEIRKLIESNKTSLNLEEYAKENHAKSLKDDALIKVLNGTISIEEINQI